MRMVRMVPMRASIAHRLAARRKFWALGEQGPGVRVIEMAGAGQPADLLTGVIMRRAGGVLCRWLVRCG
ncbi:MAG: hypothetical protein FJW30_23405 [Acidobacteria bacterium]|nr:hypothetical protein [Acidobacteriota bacterium]